MYTRKDADNTRREPMYAVDTTNVNDIAGAIAICINVRERGIIFTMTIPNKPTGPKQQYLTTLKGRLLLEFLKRRTT